MSINLDNVTAITHNNKNVIKIEDSLGNTIWEVGGPTPTDEPIYFSATKKLENNIFSDITWTGASPKGNAIWSNGTDLFWGYNTQTLHPYKLDLATQTWAEDTTMSVPYHTSPSFNTGYGNFMWTDGTNIFYSNSTVQKIYNKATKTWSDITWTGGISSFGGNGVFKIGNKIYLSATNNTTLYEVDTTNYTTTAVGTGFPYMGWTVWTDGTNYYSTSSSTYLLDFNTMTWTQKTWASSSKPSNGARIIKYNDKILTQTSNTNFYQLDVETSRWTTYTFDGGTLSSILFDNAWNRNGRWTGGVNLVASTVKQ